MRISDWSSDVCSSDLWVVGVAELQRLHLPGQLRFDRRHDLLLNQQDLDRGADLAGLAVAGIDHLRQRAVQVGIVAKNGEGDGAQFPLGPTQACRLPYPAPDLGAAGQGQTTRTRGGE